MAFWNRVLAASRSPLDKFLRPARKLAQLQNGFSVAAARNASSVSSPATNFNLPARTIVAQGEIVHASKCAGVLRPVLCFVESKRFRHWWKRPTQLT